MEEEGADGEGRERERRSVGIMGKEREEKSKRVKISQGYIFYCQMAAGKKT